MAELSFKCPNCAAPLRAADAARSVECQYCHTAVAPPWVKPTPSAGPARSPALPLAGAAVVLVVGVTTWLFVGRQPSPPPPSPAVAPTEPVAPRPAPPAPPPPKPSPVRLVLSFGEAGSNESQLTNPTKLAVASDGSIFVAESNTGRVHRFAADGSHTGLLLLEPDKLTKQLGVFGLAADSKGYLYVNRVGDIVVYDVKSLALVRTVKGDYPDTWYHGGLAVDAAGNVHGLVDRTGDTYLVTTSPAGRQLSRKRVHAKDLAIDGLGNVAMSNPGDDQLDLFDAKGELLSRAAGVKDPGPLAFDGRGHVFVGTSTGIAVVDLKGAVKLELTERADDLAFDAQGRLVTLTGARVQLSEVTLP
ncbi:MAG: hypothetical protein ACOZQL_03720 [Myxococcota bacterium]